MSLTDSLSLSAPTSTVTVAIPGQPLTTDVKAQLTLLNGGGVVIQLPITDPSAVYDNLAANWVQVTRPGRAPILVNAGGQLSTLQLNVTIAAPDGGPRDDSNTVQGIIEQLMTMTTIDNIAQPVALTWGGIDSSSVLTSTGHWHLTDVQLTSTLRQPTTNNISRATATITLTEASDPPTSGNVTGWTAPPAPPKPVVSGGITGKLTTITVQPGQTIYTVAAKVYGSPEPGWRTLLNFNGITNPALVVPGLVLAVP